MRGFVVLILISMMVSGPLWARGAYKWTDEQGVIHYSDRMRGDKASIINVKVKESEETESGDEATEEQAEPDNTRADARADKQADAKQKKLRKANCAKASEQLAANESMSRMYRAGKNGEREYLSDKERGDVIRRSLDAVKYWCD